ncbi:MAG: radical SAM protein [Candidatus Velthaea sp.]
MIATSHTRAVYSALKLFAYPDHLDARSGGAVRAPVHVRIKPINACNHRCWFCAYRRDDLQLGSDMDLKDRIPAAKMDEIVDDLIAMGVRAVTFSGGGEPLLYPGIAGVVERLAQGGIAIGCLTNGAYLTGEVADAFARYGTWIRVSTDAWDGPSLARSRDVKLDEFDRIAENMRRFAHRSACSLGVNFIINRDNAAHILEFCAFAKALGVEHVKLSACVVANDGAENNAYHETFAVEVREQIERAKAELQDDGFRIVDHYHGSELRFDKPYASCPMLEYLTVIGADCTVYTCQDKAYTPLGTLGSIRERSLREFWFSDENAKRLAELDPSRDCRHHCVSHAKNLLLHEYRELDAGHISFV